MKNLYFLIIIACCSTSLIAQPVITESITPNIDDQWTITFLETNNFDPGATGANQTWDFSGIDLTNAIDLNIQVLDPAMTLGGDNFPNASFVWYLQGFEVYEFYAANSDSISLVGGASINNGEIDFLTIFTNAEDGMHLPLNFGDAYTYDSNFDQYLFGNFLSSQSRTGNVEADGYGSITTPNGTYENVLRLKVSETSFGFTTTQYAWFDVDNFVPVFLYEFSDDPELEPTLYFSTPNIVNSLSSITSNHLKWHAWVNQSENSIQIELPSVEHSDLATLQLFNIEGKLLSTQQVSLAHEGTTLHHLALPTSTAVEHLIVTLTINGQISSKQIPVYQARN